MKATLKAMLLLCALAALKFAGIGRVRSALVVGASGLGCVYSLWTFYGAGLEATGWGAVLLASGLPVYVLMRRSSRAAAARPAVPPG